MKRLLPFLFSFFVGGQIAKLIERQANEVRRTD